MKTCVVDQRVIIKVAPAVVMDLRVVITGVIIWVRTKVAPAVVMDLRIIMGAMI